MCVIRAQEENGVLMLDISGRLTILDHHLRNTVSRFLRAGRREFVLRMKDVSYIDSCGLGELVSVYIPRFGVRAVTCGCSTPAKESASC